MTDIEDLKIGFIGAGRLGTALAWHCASSGLKVAAVASSREAAAQALAERIQGCEVMAPQDLAQRCDLIFITTPDAAIEPTAQSLSWTPGSYVVHCSGATEVDALAKAVRDGAFVGGFHPLQTFGDPEVAQRALPGSTITIEADEPLNAVLVVLAARLGCAVNRLPPGYRALYHAAAGYTSQFINVLFRESCDMWRAWGSTDEAAIQAMMPMVRGTLSAIEGKGIGPSMPGPVSRGDVGSVRKHVEAIGRFDPATLELYSVLCERTIRIASEEGRIDGERAERIRELLVLGERKD